MHLGAPVRAGDAVPQVRGDLPDREPAPHQVDGHADLDPEAPRQRQRRLGGLARQAPLTRQGHPRLEAGQAPDAVARQAHDEAVAAAGLRGRLGDRHRAAALADGRQQGSRVGRGVAEIGVQEEHGPGAGRRGQPRFERAALAAVARQPHHRRPGLPRERRGPVARPVVDHDDAPQPRPAARTVAPIRSASSRAGMITTASPESGVNSMTDLSTTPRC